MADVTLTQSGYDKQAGSNVVVTLGAPVAASAAVLLVVTLYDPANQLPIGGASGVGNTLFDDQGNVYTLVYNPAYTLNAASRTHYYLKAGISNAPQVFTVQDSNFRNTELQVWEFANVDSANPISHAGSFTTRTTGDQHPIHSMSVAAGDMAIMVANWIDNGLNSTWSVANGWVAGGNPADLAYVGYATKPFAAAGTATLDMTTASNEDWEVSGISLKSSSPIPQFYPISGGDLYF